MLDLNFIHALLKIELKKLWLVFNLLTLILKKIFEFLLFALRIGPKIFFNFFNF